MSEKKTGKCSDKTENVKKWLPNIPTDNVLELKGIIYAGEKLVCNKNGVPQRNLNRNTKPGREIRLKGEIKETAPTSKNAMKGKRCEDMLKDSNNKQTNLRIQFEMGQKRLVKEGSLKRYQDTIKQYKQNRMFQNDETVLKQVSGKVMRTNQQSDAKEAKLHSRKNIAERPIILLLHNIEKKFKD